MPLTSRDVHVDRVLSDLLINYMQDLKGFAAPAVAPIVNVQKSSDKYFVWGLGDLLRSVAATRGAGGVFPERITSLSTGTYSAEEVGAKAFLADTDREDADLDLRTSLVQQIAQDLMIRREKDFATAFFSPSVWTNQITPATPWSTAAGSDPVGDIRTGIRAVESATGKRPTDLTLGAVTADVLLDHADIVGRLSTSSDQIATPKLLASLFGLKRVNITRAVENSAGIGATDAVSYIGGKHALLTFTPDMPSKREPSACYTFALKKFGGVKNGGKIKEYRNEDRGGAYLEGEMMYDMKQTSDPLGYFFNGAVA